MKSDLERQLIQEIEALKQKVAVLEGREDPPIPTYQYSKIQRQAIIQTYMQIFN